MYVQITSRCNMTCKHCCFACTAKGTDMSRETFHKAIQIACDHEESITIGGGEPTLHPLFKEFLFHAVWELASQSESQGSPAVYMVTNGSNTDIAITLAKLAERGVIGCRVSHDQYHDPIDPRVFAAFKRQERNHYASASYRDAYDCRDTGTDFINESQVQAMGRAKNWGGNKLNHGCCGGLFCTPKGTLYPCECKRTSLGTVENPHGVRYEHFQGMCERTSEYKDEISAKPMDALGGNVQMVLDSLE